MSHVMGNLLARMQIQRPAQTLVWCFRRINQHQQAEIFKLIQESMNLVVGKDLKVTAKPPIAAQVEEAVTDWLPDPIWPIEVGFGSDDESTS